ncbi:hypothetical protein GVN20_08225 [Runella sp. CRIBMP]|uniref:RteC domain-containing protein n=1 Tax=Runella sp. CRIBMP TaxID=2683261 RepID=UPI0014129CBD|nr:RteC domain-containing protein [Runella sp. CRIBMP]NBB19335.1 hypothetical protein [Runella sp. CRIBMP]
MQKTEYKVTKLEDFLDVPLIGFLGWLAPNTFELADYQFSTMVNQLQHSTDLPKEDQKKKLDEFVASIKSVYENEYLGFIRPYLTLPLRDFVNELNRIFHLSTKNDFIFRGFPAQERNTLLSIFESKRSKRIIKGGGSLVDVVWLLMKLNRMEKLSTWSEQHIGAGIGVIHFNRKKIWAFIWAVVFKKKENFEEIIHDLASSMFGEIILKIAEYEKIKEIYPKLITSIEQQQVASVTIEPATANTPITKWKGDKVQFYQLIYALYNADFIDGEVTKIVEGLANVFDIELAKGWQANLDHNIKNNNPEYVPAIFDDLKKAFDKYSRRRLNSK